MRKRLTATLKVVAAISFALLVLLTYANRGRVLELNRLRSAADDVIAKQQIAEFMETYEVRRVNYEVELDHYNRSVELFRTDYEAYVESFGSPQRQRHAPRMPMRPQPPEVTQQLAEINTQFRAARHEYFRTIEGFNAVSALCALLLTMSLVTLLMTEAGSGRWAYAAMLAVAFVFLIGPSFHTMLIGAAGAMHPPPFPGVTGNSYYYGY